MPSVKNDRVLPYSVDVLYDVITDIEKYCDFIPWCKGVKAISRSANSVISDVEVEFLFIKEKYRSIAKFDPPQRQNNKIIARADVEMLEGSFDHFSTIWDLKSISDDKVLVSFRCDFAFKNPIYNAISKTVLMAANKKIINSFIKRVDFVNTKNTKKNKL